MSEQRELRLVKLFDGKWREWDNSIDDPMDRVESMWVREVLPEDREGPEGWTVVSMDETSVLLDNGRGRRKRYFLGNAKLVEAARAVVAVNAQPNIIADDWDSAIYELREALNDG